MWQELYIIVICYKKIAQLVDTPHNNAFFFAAVSAQEGEPRWGRKANQLGGTTAARWRKGLRFHYKYLTLSLAASKNECISLFLCQGSSILENSAWGISPVDASKTSIPWAKFVSLLMAVYSAALLVYFVLFLWRDKSGAPRNELQETEAWSLFWVIPSNFDIL